MDIINTNNLLRPQEVTNEEEQQQMERERARPGQEQENIRVRKHKEHVGTIAEKYGKDRVTISEEGQYAYKIARDILTAQTSQAGQEVIAIGKKMPNETKKSFDRGNPSIVKFIKGILGL